MKWIRFVVALMVLLVLSSCDGKKYTLKELSIQKIAGYAQSGEILPTVQDYIDAGVNGVDESNIDAINNYILELTYQDVDTKEEIQAIIDKFGVSLEDNSTLEDIVNKIEESSESNESEALAPQENNETNSSEHNHSVELNTTLIESKPSENNESVVDDVLPPLVDTTPPIITLNGESSIMLANGTSYSELGATAHDSIDGNVAVQMIGSVDSATDGIYVIVYKAVDSSNNEAFTTRVVTIYTPNSQSQDTTPPTIMLNGSATMTLTRGSTYNELGATATDSVDGEIEVTISGTVDSSTNGTYVLIYKAVDSSNNQALATRVVTVYTPYSPPAANVNPTVDAGANQNTAVNSSVTLR